VLSQTWWLSRIADHPDRDQGGCWEYVVALAHEDELQRMELDDEGVGEGKENVGARSAALKSTSMIIVGTGGHSH